MPNRNLWNKNVPRVEYNHRARDTRLRLEHTERLLVKRDAARGSQYSRLLPLLLGYVSGNGRKRGRRTGAPQPASCVLIKQPADYPLPRIGA